MMILRSLLFLTISLFCSVATANESAKEYFNEHFDIAGYIGYIFVAGTVPSLPVESGPEIGLLVNYEYDENWSAFTQFRVDTEYPEQSVAYAFVNYETLILDKMPIRLIGGKLRHQYGLYNKDRLNPRTRPGVIAPQSMYWDTLRYTLTSGYGIAIETEWERWTFKYSIDAPIIVNNRTEALIWTSGSSDVIYSNFGGHQLINLDYQADDWKILASWAFQDWGVGEVGKNNLWSLGGEKRMGDWTFSLEGWMNLNIDSHGSGASVTVQYDVNEFLTVHTNFNTYNAKMPSTTQFISFPDYIKHIYDGSVGFTTGYNDWEFRADFHVAQGSTWIPFESSFDPIYSKPWFYSGLSLVYHFD